MFKKLIAALLLFTTFLPASADIPPRPPVKKQFMFTNLDKFPGFSYSFLHHGYEPTPVDSAIVENNMRYFVSARGSQKEPLLARDKNGTYFISDIKLGGEAIVSRSISRIVEVYTIMSIKNGKIMIKKIKDIIVYKDGKEEEKKAAGWVPGSALMVLHPGWPLLQAVPYWA